ncbi:MAG: TetR/AcrR family transcriptional regulator [Cyanobacteria bacterium]|nr:TetR/AcrR family transcriptional regulator [Cyanobacteriota bacterium]
MTKSLEKPPPSASKKEAIIKEAFTVFNQYGFQSTAVDKILENSSISKRTLYKYFRSKEELIVATIHYYSDTLMNTLAQELSVRGNTPYEKLMALFDLKQEALEAKDFTGCFAIHSKTEYNGRDEERYADIESACDLFLKHWKGLSSVCAKKRGVSNPKKLLDRF